MFTFSYNKIISLWKLDGDNPVHLKDISGNFSDDDDDDDEEDDNEEDDDDNDDNDDDDDEGKSREPQFQTTAVGRRYIAAV